MFQQNPLKNFVVSGLTLEAHLCSQFKLIRVYDATGNVMEMHEHKGDFKEP